MIGTLLGNRYEILELVGTGGMANVYKAKCTMLNRFVAIKVLKEEFSNDQEFLKRFSIESQASAGLSHSNVVSVYDVGEQENIHYIVMEYVDGITLKEYLEEKGALPFDEALDFSVQIASALNHAHRKGIVHRDIKPQNIILTKDKQLKVTDFGIARAASTYTMKVDDSGFGSAHYCSPEQASGRYTDEKADIYSMGVVMYEMFTGKLPFESENSVSVAIKHIQEEPVSPREVNPEIPEAVEAVILKAMAKEQSERFQTAGEMLIELNYVNNTNKIKKENKIINDKLNKKYETKVIDVEEVRKSTKKTQKPKKEPAKKEDKVAVWAAIASSFVIVAIICFVAVAVMFPSLMPWNGAGKVEKGVAPDLVGVKLEDAVKTYKDIEFIEDEAEYSTLYDEGIIISQDPEYETKLEKPYKITVVVSKGAKIVKVPDLVNMDYREAELALDELEIIHTVQYKESETVPEDIVMKVTPSKNTKVRANSDLVTLIVSSGAPKKEVEVPDVIGETREDAEKAIEKAGLTYSIKKVNSTKPEGTVVKQSKDAGEMVVEKTNVVLSISTGTLGGEEPEEGDSGETTDKPEKPTTTKELTISLPSDKEEVTVKVTVDDMTVYEKKHKTSEGSVSVPVKGSGKTSVAYYIDGAKAGERVIEF